ncbi:3-hydroxybutyryl-CoA dehydrogenase [Kordiimonas pumila]|uniref:L-gulonate 3-dehydrogenase n=1 Tax=Kordiimonas pumila TaxID=2161677 RepID=A0ABV7D6A4_9PROT|nr:3-hydroxybutyryl-CoA dehydrogenase [Kordiimonas pumila]
MPTKKMMVGALGAGRMGRGIAISYALAGAEVCLIDIKGRTPQQRLEMRENLEKELTLDLGFLARLGIIAEGAISQIMSNITLYASDSAVLNTIDFDIVYEGVPEHRDAKEAAFQWMSEHIAPEVIIASTTSTFLVDDLAELISHPERFANAHWLNPAHLMPLVEISKGKLTSDATITALRSNLKSIGKSPVVCGPTPGYIVPRIQALAMNEAARLVEEGAASAADIDTAIRLGFGTRYAILGMLEFIDWGGGDILYYASDYLSKNIDKDRYKVPDIIRDNMHNNRKGISDGKGFYDYSNMDVSAYREKRMSEFAGLLQHMQLMPKVADFAKAK